MLAQTDHFMSSAAENTPVPSSETSALFAHHERMFEKFVRGGGPSDQGGAGLGLALVKSIVELHGGRVDLDSVPGLGAAVTCYLPV